jgi:hypothetical protein
MKVEAIKPVGETLDHVEAQDLAPREARFDADAAADQEEGGQQHQHADERPDGDPHQRAGVHPGPVAACRVDQHRGAAASGMVMRPRTASFDCRARTATPLPGPNWRSD